MAGEYEPAARLGHVAAAVEEKVYVWGGWNRSISHDGPDKTHIIHKVDILDVKVRNTLIFIVVSDSTPLDDSWLINNAVAREPVPVPNVLPLKSR